MTAYRYTTKFNSIVRGSCLECCDDFEVSEASLETLKPLIPDSVDLERNIDLVGVAFNAAVVNRFNKNGDGIDTVMGKAIKDYFINKPTNIEHNRNKIVGHIISSAFSSFKDSSLLHEEELEETPFNIALGALVYRTVNPAFAQMLEQTKEGDAYHNMISASWELGFNDYHIALGGENVGDAEIITDKVQKEEFKQFLKAYEGDGVTQDGVSVQRLIVGEVYQLGIGFTTNPAAVVEGLIQAKPKSLEELTEEKPAQAESYTIELNQKRAVPSEKKFTDSEKKCSLSENLTVTSINNTIMDTQNLIQEFEKVLTEKLGEKHSEEAVANMTAIINDSIKQKDEEYRVEKEAKEKLVETVEAQKAEFEQSISEMQEKLSQAETQLSELNEEKRQREAKELFNARMSSLEESFQLEEDDWKIVASELSELDAEEEAFASYLEKLNVVWKHKTKAYIEKQEKQFKEKVEEEIQKRLEDMTTSQASEAPADVEEILDDVEREELEAPNNSAEAAEEEPSFRDRFAAAFSKENLTIKY